MIDTECFECHGGGEWEVNSDHWRECPACRGHGHMSDLVDALNEAEAESKRWQARNAELEARIAEIRRVCR
jgi:RecJ-like exonuclease